VPGPVHSAPFGSIELQIVDHERRLPVAMYEQSSLGSAHFDSQLKAASDQATRSPIIVCSLSRAVVPKPTDSI